MEILVNLENELITFPRRGKGPFLHINSYDPGVTTGWAIHRIPIEPLLEDGFRKTIHNYSFWWAGGEITGTENQVIEQMLKITRTCWAETIESRGDVLVIALEDFVLRRLQMDRDLLSPVRINAKYDWAMRNSGIRIVFQSGNDAKDIVTDARLISWGVYHKGLEHARDAQRHGILLARKFASDRKVRCVLDKRFCNGSS